jgi:hypothetical protein
MDSCVGALLLSDGKLLAAGTSDGNIALVQYWL